MFVDDVGVEKDFVMTEDRDYLLTCLAMSKPGIKDTAECETQSGGRVDCRSNNTISPSDDVIRCSYTYQCPGFSDVTVEETRGIIKDIQTNTGNK